MNESEYEEVPVLKGAKRIGVRWCSWMGDWFNSWSPRNDNSNAEGTWHHWANLAAKILAHPYTQKVAPDLYRPDLKPDASMYDEGNRLSEDDLAELGKAKADRR